MVTRASDTERERCMRELRAAYATGRLDEHQLERRVGRAARASTRAELWAITRDLPRTQTPGWVRAVDKTDRVLLKGHAATFATANGTAVGLWAATGQGDFWPAWMLIPWTALISWHAGGSFTIRRAIRRRRATRSRAV